MDFNYIKKLVKLVEDSNISEIEVQENELRIKVTKTVPAPVYQTPMMPPMQQVVSAPQVAVTQPSEQKTAPIVAPVVPAPNQHEVKSPIVGTFYRASRPDVDAFVKVGDKVSVGQTLCIIEAMKLMNEIESDAAGTVVKILVGNGRAVEYNQPLFVVEL